MYVCVYVCMSCVLFAVFVKLLNVLIIAVDYYPVFACVTHCQRIVANIVGILYSAQMYAILCCVVGFVYTDCYNKT